MCECDSHVFVGGEVVRRLLRTTMLRMGPTRKRGGEGI